MMIGLRDSPSRRPYQDILTLWVCNSGEEFAIAVLLVAKDSLEHALLSGLHSRKRTANAPPFFDHSLPNSNASESDL